MVQGEGDPDEQVERSYDSQSEAGSDDSEERDYDDEEDEEENGFDALGAEDEEDDFASRLLEAAGDRVSADDAGLF